MSRDTIDDLHYAEDTLGALTSALEAVHEYIEANPDILPAELVDKVKWAVSEGKGYCRCFYDDDEGYGCDSACGCPAHHEHPHHGA